MRCWVIVALLLAGSLVPGAPGASAASEAWEIKDPRGDARPGVLVTAPASLGVPNPVSDAGDIVSVSLDYEDPLTLRFAIQVADMKPPRLAATGLTTSDRLYLEFQGVGNSLEYRINTVVRGGSFSLAQDGSASWKDSLCIDNGARTDCGPDEVRLVRDPAASRYTIEIPKSLLIGLTPEGKQWTRDVDARVPPTALTGLHAEIFHFDGVYVFSAHWKDEVDQGSVPPLPLSQPMVNAAIRLGFTVAPSSYGDAGRPPTPWLLSPPKATVPAGGSADLTVQVTNTRDGKRIVNLTAQVGNGDAGWSARVTPNLEVPARSTRNVTITVTASPSLAHRTLETLLVVGRSIAHPEEVAYLRLTVAAAQGLAPGNEVHRFHSVQGRPFAPGAPCMTLCERPWTWLNPLESDPDADNVASGNQVVPVPYGRFNVVALAAAQDLVNHGPLFFDATKPAVATIALRARVGVDARISVTASLDAPSGRCYRESCREIPLFGGSKDVSIPQGESVFDIPLSLTAKPRVEAAGRILTVLIQVSTDDAKGLASGLDGMGLLLPKSRIEYPVLAPTTELIADSYLKIYPEGETDEFVNPGESRLYRIRVANEGPKQDRIRLLANASAEDWDVTVQPGDRFDLAPGESASIGILLAAPKSAREGEVRNVTVRIESELEPTGKALLFLRATAVTGADVQDDSSAFKADEDTAARVVKPPSGRSPGFGIVGVLFATVALLVFRRR